MSPVIDERSVWIRESRRASRPRLRLFCLPFAGGTAAMFRQWPNHLPDEIEVCAVQLPGREERWRETPYRELSSLLAPLTRIVGSAREVPFAVFGHSMGALIGFELVRALRAQGGPMPCRLFVSGRRAPHLPARTAPFHKLDDARLIEALRNLGGTPEAVLREPELMALFLPMLRADFSVNETYAFVPGEPLPVPISAFYGTEDPQASAAEVAAWADHTSSGFQLRAIPGGHFFVNSATEVLVKGLLSDLPL